MLITSLDNERVKRILNLHNRHWREQVGLYLVEGYNLVREALEVHADPYHPSVVRASLCAIFSQRLVAATRAPSLSVTTAAGIVLYEISGRGQDNA